MHEKAVGYTLITLGILIMLFSVVNIFLVFTKQLPAIQLFNFPGISLDVGQLMSGSLPQELQALGGKNLSMKQEFFPAEMVNAPLNLSAHFFLMSFILTAGFKLASLGVMLVRPLVVKVKEKIV